MFGLQEWCSTLIIILMHRFETELVVLKSFLVNIDKVVSIELVVNKLIFPRKRLHYSGMLKIISTFKNFKKVN